MHQTPSGTWHVVWFLISFGYGDIQSSSLFCLAVAVAEQDLYTMSSGNRLLQRRTPELRSYGSLGDRRGSSTVHDSRASFTTGWP